MTRRNLALLVVVAAVPCTSACTQTLVLGTETGSDGGAGGGAATYTSSVTGPRPGMVAVPSPGGVTYYVDSTEVSQAAYDVFVKSDPPASLSSSLCAGKTSFAPGHVDLPGSVSGLPFECTPDNSFYDPVGTATDPVVCVDWCDADAYCRWAGKRLCGRIGGGPTMQQDVDNASESQWYNACSNGGTTPFPYGDTFEPGACNVGSNVVPVGTTPSCHGEAAPFDGLFDMIGNVFEWEDWCTDFGEGVISCSIRGGSFDYGLTPGSTPPPGTGAGATCRPEAGDNPRVGRPWEGFRCCAD